MTYTIEGIQSGIDWLSNTAPLGEPNGTQWKHNSIRALEQIAKGGNVVQWRKLQGYEGVSAGNCFFGERDDGALLQLTGEYANAHFSACFNRNGRVPRIDLQFTAKFATMPASIAKKGYSDAKRSNDDLPDGRKRKLYIIVGSDGGDTLYIGAPSSDQRGRLYNKAVQSELPTYTRSWRYEVVFRNELAYNIAARLPSDGNERAEYVLAVVCAWYEARGVDCGIYYTGTRPPLPLQRALPTDVERKLRWIKEQVAPTVRYLNELGFRDTLLAELFPQPEPDSV